MWGTLVAMSRDQRPGLAARVQRLETLVNMLIDRLDERLGAIEDAHNAIDHKFEDLFYRVMFVMQHITVRRKVQGIITSGTTGVEEKTLMEFFLRDGEAWIAQVKAESDALAKNLAQIDADRDDTNAKIRAAVADTRAATTDDVPPPAGDAIEDPIARDIFRRIAAVAGSKRPF